MPYEWLEIMLPSAVKGKTKLLLTGIRAIDDLFDLQTEMLLSALDHGQNFCLKVQKLYVALIHSQYLYNIDIFGSLSSHL